ncbi:hypothetical protein BDP27DRAFT_1365802 [Rhodocollybia butyracea]|uniref:Uncharacterized protein n=1 Tax=Rhodocollybia butyracea TaxID=206335 RepID=A0A9P5U418_9AGAR|nr:hypothetical protein BDP27DRAFT_1365802 [Rhodocollybia butyracea]
MWCSSHCCRMSTHHQKQKDVGQDTQRAKEEPVSLKRPKFGKLPLEAKHQQAPTAGLGPSLSRIHLNLPLLLTCNPKKHPPHPKNLPHHLKFEPPELPEESQKLQTMWTIEEFLAILPLLLHLILSTEASAQVDLICSCGSNLRFCFLEAHKNNLFHWAGVWQDEGYYQKCDISMLENGVYSVHTCTESARCSSPGNPQLVTIVDSNGIYKHQTQVPSRDKIYENLLSKTMHTNLSFNTAEASIFMLKQALSIKQKQYMELYLIWSDCYNDNALDKELRGLAVFSHASGSYLIASIPNLTEPEDENLFLPGSLSEEQRKMEVALREADLYSSVSNVRDAARAKSLAYKDKRDSEEDSRIVQSKIMEATLLAKSMKM